MTKKEFCFKMAIALHQINNDIGTCSSIVRVSPKALVRYLAEFRVKNSESWWIHEAFGIDGSDIDVPYTGELTKEHMNYKTDILCIRQCFWQQFLDMSLENKLYLEY